MAGSSQLVETILDLLSPWGGVAARRMFSGHGLFRDGAMFGLVVRDTFYLRVDDSTRGEFIERGMAPFTYARKSKTVEMTGYHEAPPDLFDDADEMLRWSARALTTAQRRRKVKRKPRR